MQDLNDKITGGNLTANEFNEPMSELQNIIEATGQTLSSGDVNQLGKGIAGYVANGRFYTDSGIANAYVLTQIGLKQAPTAYTDGMTVEFVPDNSNTGASTVDVAGLGAKNISNTSSDGEIQINRRIALTYNSTSGEFEISRIFPSFIESLHANRTYYVRTDGDDGNTGLVNSSGGAFLTAQKAIDVVMNTINLNGYNVTIDVGDGTYTSPVIVDGQWMGRGRVTLQGNTVTPSNVLLDVTNTSAIQILNGAVLYYGGFKVQTTTAGHGVLIFPNSLGFQNGKMDFGACVNSHIDCQFGSTIYITADYTISGGATIHWHVGSSGASVEVSGAITITLTGTPAFTWFAGNASAVIRCQTATFIGAATGIRFLVYKNGFIDVGANGLSYLPGNVVGSQTGAGTYTHNTSTHVTGIDEGIINGKIEGANAAGPAILNEAASFNNPTLVPNRADLDTGIGWSSSDVLNFIAGGSNEAFVSTSGIGCSNVSAGFILNEVASSINATLIPNRSDLDTGIGWNSADKGSLVAGGVEAANWDSTGIFTALALHSVGPNIFTASATIPLSINRLTDDGVLINLLQDSVSEGNINVSGTTVNYVSFCGAHLSQLKNNLNPDIPRGTVVDTIDEMCEWIAEEWIDIEDVKHYETYEGDKKIGDSWKEKESKKEQVIDAKTGEVKLDPKTEEPITKTITKSITHKIVRKGNDQLGKFKVSDTKGSKRVYGVFCNWDSNKNANIQALGATVIRVVGAIEGGTLLESAGDGTAKAQKDDIIRSSTIGKVAVGNKTEGETLVPVTLYCG